MSNKVQVGEILYTTFLIHPRRQKSRGVRYGDTQVTKRFLSLERQCEASKAHMVCFRPNIVNTPLELLEDSFDTYSCEKIFSPDVNDTVIFFLLIIIFANWFLTLKKMILIIYGSIGNDFFVINEDNQKQKIILVDLNKS